MVCCSGSLCNERMLLKGSNSALYSLSLYTRQLVEKLKLNQINFLFHLFFMVKSNV